MRADRAAAYLDLPKSTFLKLVEQGTMPKPKRKGGMIRWDRLELDAAFDDLSAVAEIEAVNTFDEHFKGELK
jgi:excisionase family DNA binding protein